MEQLVNFIIRPPRADYNPKHDLLDQEFMLKGRWFQRRDLEVKNDKGLVLKCSHYVPLIIPEGSALPCVIYCHGNSGCRADASEAAIILLPSNITVFTLDFSGSGLSEGEHVTLGWNEKEDLRAVVNHLRTDGNVSCIGLWGRSMGAVTCLMYGAEDPSIAGMVLDSPFSNLVDLMMELVDTYKYPLPKFTVKLAIQHMRRVIKKKANFDIMDLDTIQVAKRSFVPALFGHATDDDFIQPHHSDRIYDSYTGDKNIIKFDGDHNSPRPQFYFDSITIFFHNVLNPPKDVYDEKYYHTMHDYFDEDDWVATSDQEYRSNKLAMPSLEPSTSSTEDAIDQVRIKRPMSRMEVPSNAPQQEKLVITEEDQTPCVSHLSSSSNNVETSNGPNGTPVSSVLDDQYLEYSFDGLSDMPGSIEDEERMIMEAIMLSLKDVKMTSLEENQTPNGATTSVAASDTVSTCNSGPECSSSGGNEANFASELASSPAAPCTESVGTLDANSSKHEPIDVQSNSNASSSTPDNDTVAGTRARLVVQKTPASHILDGLAHRWGNFFRSSG